MTTNETTTTEAPVSCRCGGRIILAGRSWIMTDETGRVDFHCPDGSPHEPACPPSAVHEMIIPWDEVRDGDLVLNFRGELGVATVMPQGHAWCPDGHVSVCIDGQWCTPRKDRLTAVRRYDAEG
jgi:hypothetical protein